MWQPNTAQGEVCSLLGLCGGDGGKRAPLCLAGEQSSTSAFKTALLMPALPPAGILLNLREDFIPPQFTPSLLTRLPKKNSLLVEKKGARLRVQVT